MGHQIIKQPNGKFAVWSSGVDDFILIDATPEEIVQDYVEKESERIRKEVADIVTALERGGKPSGMTFDKAVAWVRRHHSPDAESLQMLGLATPIPESCKRGEHQWTRDDTNYCGKDCETWYCPGCAEQEERSRA